MNKNSRRIAQQSVSKRNAHNLNQRFNHLYPVGSKVRWRSVKNSDDWKILIVRSKATAGFFFAEGRAGYLSIEDCFVDYSFRAGDKRETEPARSMLSEPL